MTRLEYRLAGAERAFPQRIVYERIGRGEVALRFACDYLVRDGTVYETVLRVREDDSYVIHARVAEEEQATANAADERPFPEGICVELREFNEKSAVYPIIHVFCFRDEGEVLLHLQSDVLVHRGNEWHKTSVEVDEDRRVYVVYAAPGPV